MNTHETQPHTSFPESMGGGKADATELPTVASAAIDPDHKALGIMDWEGGTQAIRLIRPVYTIPTATEIATRNDRLDRVALASVGSMDWGS